jgi:GNAT superfamily N-acetyltransferase
VAADPLSVNLLEQKVWSDPDFDEQLTRVSVIDNQIVGWGMLVHRRQPANRGHLKFLVVDGPFQRQQIGSRLLTELEEAALRRGVVEIRIDESTPNYLNPGIDERYVNAVRFLDKHGYRQLGSAVHQRVDLSSRHWPTAAEEERLASLGISIRRAVAADWEPVRSWLEAHWPAWIPEVACAFSNEPLTLHLAWEGNRVIGFSAYDTNNLGLGWFGPMGSDPGCRGLGIGRVLLYRCLADQQQQGHVHVIIPWVGPVDFYRQHANAQLWRTFRRMAKTMTVRQEL